MSNIGRLQEVSSPSAEAFRALLDAANAHGTLEPKQRELCLLVGFAVTGNESAFRSHCTRAMQSGAGQADVEQAVLLMLGTSLGLVPVVEALLWAREEFGQRGS
ncbi:carboxymuconolactone decarboxylase family protein [Arthrobacter sp. AK01]|uniref:carboxymuconolactone decarboxylase family protein n=1 Tax=Arthrobacter sp. AK01 TaxID=2894084 RepID=UPI001E36A8E2|nr:carboxymuconolactone decarboxylase family protein [Arthrobacter sp. AK01]MCD4853695.1 carboxymuconolactone decarboxylase family protein [Arthrobacter sp. AK01]